MKKIIGNILTVFIMVLTGVMCSNQPVQTVEGGGTETVIGKIVFEDGGDAVGTQIEIIPIDFNPVSDGALPDSMHTTTDNDGKYIFDALPSGTYNIIALHPDVKVQSFRSRVVLSDDVVLNITDTLKQPGAAKVILADTVDTDNGYVFIKGTTISRSLLEGSVLEGGLYSLILNEIPAATFSELQYAVKNETVDPILLKDIFTVTSLDTVLIEVFDYSIIIGSVIFENGVYASGTHVSIVPAKHIPLKDGPLPGFMIDTTGVNGEFIFKLTSRGNYNIQAVHPQQRVYLFVSNISVGSDTVLVSTGKLTDPGTVKLILPDTMDTGKGYLVVEGTTFYSSLSQSSWLDTGFNVHYFDSLPAATHSAMYYLPENLNPQKAVDTITIISQETVQKEAFVHWYHYSMINSGLPTNNILDMVIEGNGTKWFGTDEGVVKFDGTGWQVYNKSNSDLFSDTIMSVTVNTDGVKWFGTTKGVAKYDGATWETFTTGNSELPNDSIFEVVADGSGNIWIGTDTGAAKYDDNGNWEVFTPDNSPFPNINGAEEVYCIAIDLDGNVWLGTDGGGLIRIEGNNWTIFNELNSELPSKAIFSIYVDDKNNKWIGTFGGVAFYNNTTWEFYHTGSHISYKYVVSSVSSDKNDIKWFGTYEGGRIFRYDGERMVTYNTKTSIISPYAYEMFAIQVDKDDYKWVPTSRGGIYVFGPVD